MATTKSLTAKELAERLGTDPRTVRKFLRDELGTVGKGSRHEIKAAQVQGLKKKFATWTKAREEARTAKTAE